MIIILYNDRSNEQFRVLSIRGCTLGDNRSVFVRVRWRLQSGSWQKFADTAIETLDHAVCLGMAWGNEAMVDAGAGAGLVKDMIAGRLFLPGSEAVGELRAIVRQDRANVNRAGGLQAFEEIQAAFFALADGAIRRRATPARRRASCARCAPDANGLPQPLKRL
jgi:hypothetical protein